MHCNWRVSRKHWPSGPQTPDTDWVHGLPTDQPQNRIKYKNEDLITYCFSNRSLVSAKFRALRWEKCNRPGYSIGRKFILVYCHFHCCGYKYPWKNGKTLGSLEICAPLTAFHPPFCSIHSPALRQLVSGFTIWWEEIQIYDKYGTAF